MKKVRIGKEQAIQRIRHYCAYQERAQQEVRDKLYELGMTMDEVEEIMSDLIAENFLNEERFAKIFAGSKFRVKQWGRQKIKYELKARKLSEYCIKVGMAEIEDEDYRITLQEILEKKKHELRTEKQPLILKQKLARYALGKGFESDLVWEMIGKIVSKK